MKLQAAYKQIARADGLAARIDKLAEEWEEALAARMDYEETQSDEDRQHFVEELADLSVCIETLIELLGEREAFENLKAFKTYRELCRRWLVQPKWCASNPEASDD